jgi:integrase
MAKSPGTHARYRTTVEQFMASLGDKADRPISAITSADIQSFINLRVGSGLAAKTVVVDVKSLNNAFNRARRQGLIENNPVEAVDLPAVESSTRKPFTVAEAKWIFDATSDKDWSTAIALGYYLGARLGDCVNMKWDNVNFNDGVIVYSQKKVRTGRSKTVVTPLHPQLEQYLMKLAGTDQPEEFLCPSLANKNSGGSKGLSAQFKEIMLQANVDPETVPGMGRRKFSRKSFHSFRHTLPTSLEREGVPETVHMKLSGHASRDVHSLYTHTELATLKAAIGKLPKLELGD